MQKKFFSKLIKSLLALTLVFGVVNWQGLITRTSAAAGDVPAHSKNLIDNGDGTYKLALSITGEAEKRVTKTNVIVVFDRSGSMNATRMSAAKSAVNNLANMLLSKNGVEGNPADWFEMALIYFSTTANRSNPTTSYNTFSTAVNNLNANGGTNWEDALQEVTNVTFPNDADDEKPNQTYVIFVSDGNPTFRNTFGDYDTDLPMSDNNNWNRWNYDTYRYDNYYYNSEGVYGLGSDNPNQNNYSPTSMQRCYDQAKDDAKAIVDSGKTLYTIGAYGNAAWVENLTIDAGAGADHYYSADDSAALNEALEDILAKITMAGIADAEVDDGTTSNVPLAQAQGEVTTANLLVVDPDSFKYYRQGGSYTGTTSYTDTAGATVVVGTEWTDIPAACKAKNENGTVKWDLSSQDVLENGVKYTVTFDVYPSQYTLDLIADLKNGKVEYDDLDENVKKYITPNAAGTDYLLKTNTNASISWDDTRDDAGKQSSNYVNPDPVDTAVTEMLSIAKEWENKLDGREAEPITLSVTRDGEDCYSVTLGNKPVDPETGEVDEDADPVWKDSVYISIGILSVSGTTVTQKTPGHEYTFDEPEDMEYYWELEVPVVRPMLINKVVTLLVKVDEAEAPAALKSATAPAMAQDGGKTYYKLATNDANDPHYYVVDNAESASLTAINHRKSYLNFVKKVNGSIDDETKFAFAVTVDESENQDVWFSVFDPETKTYITRDALASTTGVTFEVKDGKETGYAYVADGTTVEFNLKPGWSVRFLNLPTGSTYEIVEGDASKNADFFELEKIDLSITTSDGEDEWVDIEDTEGEHTQTVSTKTAEGTIGLTNAAYEYTFTNKSVLKEFTVEKVWSDGDDQDGIRPESVAIQLLANGTAQGNPVTLDESNNWKYTFVGLAPLAADGTTEIKYTVDEVKTNVITGTDGPGTYAIAVTGSETAGFTVTNTHTPETVKLIVKKVWDDAQNQDGKRPETLVVTLSDNSTVTLNEGNNWQATKENLPKYEDGELIEYTWTEGTMPTGYTMKGEPAVETSTDGSVTTITTTFTNKYDPEKTTVSVEKTWVDGEDQDGIRPEYVEVQLLADGTAKGTAVKLDDSNEWKYTWEGLDVYASGKEIKYTVEEVKTNVITGTDGPGTYKYEVTGDAATGYKVINTHTPEVTEATVKKVWDDAQNQDGIRPESLEVTLSDGTKVTLNEANGWEAKVDKLPKYNKGVEITYTWTEGKLPEGYKLTDTAKSGTVTTLTNSHTPEETEATVKKVWDDAQNQDGKRPESLEVTLSNGTKVTLNEDNSWTATVDKLPKYANGQEIVYTWTEGTLPEGYKLTNTAKSGTVTTLTNSYTPEETEATVKKVWDDAQNQDGKRPESLKVTLSNGTEVLLDEDNSWTATVDKLPKYANGQEIVYTWTEGTLPEGYELTNTSKEGTVTTLTNSHTPEETEATVKKVWNDAQNQDGKRPESLEVTLSNGTKVTLNETNGWEAKVDKLPKYANGQEIVYTWTEGTMPTGYSLTDTSKNGTVTTLTNSYDPEKTSVLVQKVWEDAKNQDGIRPTSIKVQLSADGTAVGEAVTLDASNEWKYTWSGLDVYAAGEEIEYTVDEIEVPEGYEKTVSGDAATGYKITNTHTPATVEVPVEKKWVDADNQDGIRPAKIVAVLLKDGEAFKEIDLNADNSWKYTWTGLDKFKAEGVEIKYTVDEKEVPAGYTKTQEGNVITNTHTPATVEVPVEKVWDDAGNQDGIRPEKIKVNLLADGTVKESYELVEAESWKHTFTGLPKFKDQGTEIKYTVEEPEVPTGYTMTQEGNVITNKHEPEVIDISVKKVWEDADNNDGKRPSSITVSLLSDGEKIRQLTLNDENKWTETVTGLPKYKAGEVGKEITYKFDELKIEGYTPTYSDITDGLITITNTHEKELINVPVEKIWKGDEDYLEYRPEKITVVLVADGKETNMTVELNKDNEWKNSFKDLEKYSAGKEIDYTVKEIDLPAHYTTTEPDGNKTKGYKITNTFAPILFDPPVVKTIVGDKNDTSATFEFEMVAVTEGAPMPKGAADGKITVTLPADGKPHEFGEVVITEVGKYEYIIREVAGEDDHYAYDATEYHLLFDVDVNAENELVCQLTVSDGETETIVPWKELSGFPFEFVNEYRDYVTLEIEKVWDDGNDAQKVRPAEIEVDVLANDEVIITVVLDKDNDWKEKLVLPFSDDNYKEVTYTVKEKNVPEGYTVSYSQNEYKFTVTNTITPPDTGDASGISMWLAMFGVSVTNSLGLAYVSLKRKKEEQF